jgi:hypothetical protein
MGGACGMVTVAVPGAGPAPPHSLSGAVYGGDLVRGLGDHVGHTGDAELAEMPSHFCMMTVAMISSW